MNRLGKRAKIVALDSLAVLCLLGALLFGWVPGPGGLPLLLAGLGLLAVNHEWARRWLLKIRDSSSKINDLFFPDTWWVKLLYDLFTAGVIIAAIYILNSYDRNLIRSAAIVLFGVALGITLFNRRRLEKISNYVKSKH